MTPLYLFFCITDCELSENSVPFIFKTEKTYMKAAHLSDNLLADRKPERRHGRQIDSKTSRGPEVGARRSCVLCPCHWRDN